MVKVITFVFFVLFSSREMLIDRQSRFVDFYSLVFLMFNLALRIKYMNVHVI